MTSKVMKQTTEYLIAYMDLLGVKNNIKEDLFDDYLNLLDRIYEESIYYIKAIVKNSELRDIKIKIFSDNIIFAYPIENNQAKNIDNLIVPFIILITAFQYHCLKYGEILRGGITIDKLFIDDKFVYGNGLLNAYYIEDNIAIYPRVILDNKVLKRIKDKDFKLLYLEQDTDCNYYINYLLDLFLNKKLNKNIDYIRKRIILGTHVVKGQKERSKWYWLADKFNKFCTENDQFKNYEIDVDNIDVLAKEIQRENKLKLSKQGGRR